MTNPHGTPIWYELQARDPDAAKAFYDAVIGWTVGERPDGAMDYRMIETGGSMADGGAIGGVMRLTDEMAQGGARPGWMMYVGVDDVDASAAAIAAAGGALVMGPWDMPGVGRMAVAADPQGIPFYIMRGASEESSTAFDRAAPGRCSWNELATPDQEAADAFYGEVFGWTYPDRMAMPGMGDYIFVAVGDTTIGATMTAPAAGPPPGWRFYFRAPDIDAAAAAVTAGGGIMMMGPQEVPSGDRIIIATDPEGAIFGVVAGGAT